MAVLGSALSMHGLSLAVLPRSSSVHLSPSPSHLLWYQYCFLLAISLNKILTSTLLKTD